MVYQVEVIGELDQSWSEWLGHVQIEVKQLQDGSVISILTMEASDQSALFGLLDRIQDLNMTLVTVTRDGQI